MRGRRRGHCSILPATWSTMCTCTAFIVPQLATTSQVQRQARLGETHCTPTTHVRPFKDLKAAAASIRTVLLLYHQHCSLSNIKKMLHSGQRALIINQKQSRMLAHACHCVASCMSCAAHTMLSPSTPSAYMPVYVFGKAASEKPRTAYDAAGSDAVDLAYTHEIKQTGTAGRPPLQTVAYSASPLRLCRSHNVCRLHTGMCTMTHGALAARALPVAH